MMKLSAMGERAKMTTLTQECIMRMRNTSSTRAEIISNTVMTKMKHSGYSSKQRKDVMEAGLKGYYRMVAREEAGGRKVNRPASEGAEDRDIKRVNGAESWFRETKRLENEGEYEEGVHPAIRENHHVSNMNRGKPKRKGP